MISKNEILSFVKHVRRKSLGLPDRRFIHPNRDWLIGVAVFLLILTVGIFYNLQIFRSFQDTEDRAYSIDLNLPTYNQALAKRVLQTFSERESAYQEMKNDPKSPSVQVVEDLPNPFASSSWLWVESFMVGNEVIKPVASTSFVLSFLEENIFVATTDCNNLSGSYELEQEIVTFGLIAATKKFCGADTQEQIFAEQLGQVTSYSLKEKELEFNFYRGAGAMRFLRAE